MAAKAGSPISSARAGTPISPTRWSAAAPAGPIRFKGDPVFLPFGDPWERFRVGPAGSWNDDKAKRTTYPGTQFPIEAYEQFMKQGVPRWVTTDDQIVAAYIELVDKVCPCVVMVHSQSGSFGYRVLEARPGQGQGAGRGRADGRRRPQQGGVDQEHARSWSCTATTPRTIRAGRRSVRAAWTTPSVLKAAGGSVDVVDLPDAGIKGNSHMVMMDKNSDQVADLIQKWLVGKGLAD